MCCAQHARGAQDKSTRDEATARVRDFYDGPANTIYKTTWGAARILWPG